MPFPSPFPSLAIFLLATLTLSAVAESDDWPQFRGPGGQGHATAKNLPLRWSENENVAWKTPIAGRGWSSPVVVGDQVWLTTALETEAMADELRQALEKVGVPVPSPHVAGHVTLKAVGLDRASGQVVHDVTLFEDDDPEVLNSTNSYASPTPVAEAGRVYCDFGATGTACVDTATGCVLWSRRLAVEYQVGPGSSLILHGQQLIVVRDGCDVQYIAALDKTTGETVWRTERPSLAGTGAPYRKAFSTPLVFRDGDVEQMIVLGARWVASYDPATGAERWRVDTGGSFSNASRPVYADGLVFVCTAYGSSRMLAIRIDGQGDVTQTHVAWTLQRGTPKMSSPLLVDGCLYMVADQGIAGCVDARTGELIWSERLNEPHLASPIYADGRIYFFGEGGTTTVIQPGRQFRRLAENRVDGKIMATPAFVGSQVFLRGTTHLYRFGE